MPSNQKDIKVTVTFAAAEKPFHHDYEPTTPISEVLDAALAAIAAMLAAGMF